jgi:hypothetical protein
MNDTQENLLILKFLKNNYPVYRFKQNNRFKRSIKLDDGQIYYLSDKKSTNDLYFSLLSTIKTVFYINEEKAENVLKLFLNIK